MKNAPENEQQICVNCGFCCDHTLFDIAGIRSGEELPEKFVHLEEKKDGQRFFKLPCPYFDSKCTIYQEEKAIVCGQFRCKVLKDLEKGELSENTALQIVLEIKKQRDSLVQVYEELMGEKVTFRNMRWKLQVLFADGKLNDDEQVLYQKMLLLDVHLGQNFRSKESFDNQFEILQSYE